MKRISIGLFICLIVILWVGLKQDPSHLPSALINHPMPLFKLGSVFNPEEAITSESLKGRVMLLNVWASWCMSCAAEHEVLTQIKTQYGIPIVGLNYKDKREQALAWLKYYGNPYVSNAFDEQGKIAIDWGVYGTPETFVIDTKGIIRYRHVGPLDWTTWQNVLWPIVQKLS